MTFLLLYYKLHVSSCALFMLNKALASFKGYQHCTVAIIMILSCQLLCTSNVDVWFMLPVIRILDAVSKH